MMRVYRFILLFSGLFSLTALFGQPAIQKGVIDFSGFSIEGKSLRLEGQWAFYHREFVNQEDLKNRTPEDYVTSGTMWTTERKGEKLYPGQSYGTYHLKVIGLPKNQVLGVVLKRVYTASALYINGKLITRHGKLAKSRNENPEAANYIELMPFYTNKDTTDIILQVSNFHHAQAGMYEAVEIGDYQYLKNQRNKSLFVDFLVFGGIMIMALYHLVLYLLRRRSLTALYFSLYASAVAVRTLLVGNKAFNEIFSEAPYALLIKVEYYTFFMGVAFFMVFARSLYAEISKLFTKIFMITSVLFTLVMIAMPTRYMVHLLNPYQLISLIGVVFAIIGLVKALINKRDNILLMFASIIVIFFALVNDILISNEVIKSIEMSSYALFAFVFIQSYILAKRFNNAFIENEKLSETLDYQNKNLEKIVKQRTAEIEQQKEEILAQSELLQETNRELEKLSVVADKTDNAVIITDGKGNIEWLNQGFIRMYGFNLKTLKEKLGENIIEIYSKKEVKTVIRSVLELKESKTYETVRKNKKGEKVWAQTTLTPVLDEDSQIQKLVAIDTDISALKEAEAEILQRNEEILTQKEVLQQKNEEISAQRDELQSINKQLDISNQNIKASIKYALNIQKAILPKEETIKKAFNDTFIYYKPKDIVSGDFYWFSKQTNQSGLTCNFLVVADCTGHGVPGAFMSMIGSRLLNSIVNERKIHNPAEILELLDQGTVKALKQKSSAYNDGMDVAVVKHLQTKDGKHELTFSGAKRPFYFVKKSEMKMQRIGGTRRSIGGTNIKTQKQSFENESFIFSEGDTFYLSSDGFIDQNNSERTRFGSLRFEELLNSLAKEKLKEQKEIISQIYERWAGKEEQRDDITIVAVRL